MFIDESGDAGIQGKDGSSPHFVVAGVLFPSEDAAGVCRRRIEDFRQTVSFKRPEFKFNGCSVQMRESFLRAVDPCDFQYLAIVLNKGRLRGPGFRFKDSLYKYTVSLLMSNALPFLDNAIVVFDQCGGRDFRRTMTPYIMQKTKKDGATPVKRVLAMRSHSEPLLQMADMVAGSVARHFKPSKADHRTCREIIQKHELGVQFWPN